MHWNIYRRNDIMWDLYPNMEELVGRVQGYRCNKIRHECDCWNSHAVILSCLLLYMFPPFIKKKDWLQAYIPGQGSNAAHTNTTYIPAMQKWLCCPELKLSHTLSIPLTLHVYHSPSKEYPPYPYLPTITPSPAVNPTGPTHPVQDIPLCMLSALFMHCTASVFLLYMVILCLYLPVSN